jgi:phospholipid/cholesterol/gamma-HCH transport system ATP-binding protein
VALMKLHLVGLKEFANHMLPRSSAECKSAPPSPARWPTRPRNPLSRRASAGLDPITSAELDQLILRLARTLGVTFVVVTHELASIYTIADRVIMLDKRVKKIVAEGKPAELRDSSENPWVRQFFRREAPAPSA